jgi:hypothetical protein
LQLEWNEEEEEEEEEVGVILWLFMLLIQFLLGNKQNGSLIYLCCDFWEAEFVMLIFYDF